MNIIGHFQTLDGEKLLDSTEMEILFMTSYLYP